MKFQVIGQNRDTGARMTLEFEAESRAAAERKALQQGMDVHRVVDVTDGQSARSHEPGSRSKNRGSGGGKIVPIVIVAVLVVLAWIYRGWIKQRLGM